MKKTFLAVFFSLFIFSAAQADLGLNVGVTAQVGSMETSAQEASSDGTTEKSGTEEALFGTAGMFIEKDLSFLPGGLGDGIGSRIAIGYDNIAHELDLGTQTNYRVASLGASGATVVAGANTVKATVTDFTSLYVTLHATDWLYLKAGSVTVDLDTRFTKNEVLQTSYGSNSHSLDGSVWGFGIQKTSDNGMFFRLEWNEYDIDGKKVASTGTDSKFTVTLNDTTGSTGRISVGKSF